MNVVVIGGGPAGMMSAISSAENGNNVILLEKKERLGRKLLITGKGRCNITSSQPINEFIQNIPGNGQFLYSAFKNYTNNDIIDFLNKTSLTDKTYTYEYFKNHTAEFEFYYKDFLDTINEYLEEIKKSNTAEDKNFWITGINEELKNLPLDGKLYSYEYEIELIKRKGYKNEEEN